MNAGLTDGCTRGSGVDRSWQVGGGSRKGAVGGVGVGKVMVEL